MEEAKQLVSTTKARLKQDSNMFDWQLTDSDQGMFDTKMMVFLCLAEGVIPMIRMKVLNNIQQGLTSDLVFFINVNVRAALELDPIKRPWNKAQAIFIGEMTEYANQSRDAFDTNWVDSALPVSVAVPL